MQFENLHADINFDCLERELAENQKDFFARKLKSSNLTGFDFLSHWERGIKPEKNTIDEVCRHKGVSINKYDNESELIKL